MVLVFYSYDQSPIIEFIIVVDSDYRITPVLSDPTNNMLVICWDLTEPIPYMKKYTIPTKIQR